MTNHDLIQIFGFLLFATLGIVFIIAFSTEEDPYDIPGFIEEPASPAAIDHKKIMDSIAKCTTIEQIRRVQEAADRFYDLHWKKINTEVLKGYWIALQEAISKRQKEIYGQKVAV